MKPTVRSLLIPAVCQALLCTSALAAKPDDGDSSDKKKDRQEQRQPAQRQAPQQQAPQRQAPQRQAPQQQAAPQRQAPKPEPRKEQARPERKPERSAAPETARAPEKRVQTPNPQRAEKPQERKVEKPANPRESAARERTGRGAAEPPKPDRQPENQARKPETARRERPAETQSGDSSAAAKKTDRTPEDRAKSDPAAGRAASPPDATADRKPKDVVPPPPDVSGGRNARKGDPDRVAKTPQEGRNADAKKPMPLPGKRPDPTRTADGKGRPGDRGPADTADNRKDSKERPGETPPADPAKSAAATPPAQTDPAAGAADAKDRRGDARPDPANPTARTEGGKERPGNRTDPRDRRGDDRPDRDRDRSGRQQPDPANPAALANDGRQQPGESADRRDRASADNRQNPRDRRDERRPTRPLDLPGNRPNVRDAGRNPDRNADRDSVYQADRERQARYREMAAARGDQPRPARQVVRPGQNTRQLREPDFVTRDGGERRWWNEGNRAIYNNNDVRVVNRTTVINNNFTRNVNWTTRRGDWGYNPWWNRPQVRPWYGSSWNYAWSHDYYHHHHDYDRWRYGYRPPGYVTTYTAVGWGLVGWSLGAMVYNSGYQTYYNPYYARPVAVAGYREISYSQPITRVAVSTAPAEDHVVEEITRKSESIIADSQAAFKRQDYLVALELADKAVAESPGDGALHEYRALVLFALGKYGEAAGVLNPVLASGPGWDWSTMIALYDSQQVYTDQLQRLEAYTEKNPDAADMHFLLGYHYMVCGHLDLATPQFDAAARLMPKDNVSRQLADLTRSSAKDAAEETPPTEVERPGDAPPPPLPLEKLTGVWVSKREGAGDVTLTFSGDGKFTWVYDDQGRVTRFSGDYSLNDDGLLVLDSQDTQMVASVDLVQDQQMKFVLAGGQPGDPGLDFKKG